MEFGLFDYFWRLVELFCDLILKLDLFVLKISYCELNKDLLNWKFRALHQSPTTHIKSKVNDTSANGVMDRETNLSPPWCASNLLEKETEMLKSMIEWTSIYLFWLFLVWKFDSLFFHYSNIPNLLLKIIKFSRIILPHPNKMKPWPNFPPYNYEEGDTILWKDHYILF